MNLDLLTEASRHFNEPILIGFNLCRCVGYAEDNNDCYLISRIRPAKFKESGLEVKYTWTSFVGGYTYLDSLKGQGYCKLKTGEEIDDLDDFYRLDKLLELNGVPREDTFIYIDNKTEDED